MITGTTKYNNNIYEHDDDYIQTDDLGTRWLLNTTARFMITGTIKYNNTIYEHDDLYTDRRFRNTMAITRPHDL